MKQLPDINKEQLNRSGLLSLELPDGNILYVRLQEKVTVKDVLDYLAVTENPYLSIGTVEKERMGSDEAAGYEQSRDCKFSIEASMNSDTVRVYEINEGRGGAAETERTDENIKFTNYSLSDYSSEKFSEQIKTAAKKLMIIAVTGKNADETLVRQIRSYTDAAVQKLSETLAKKWPDAAGKKPVEVSFKVQSGINHEIEAENQKDMLTGCINRMHIAEDSEEFKRMVKGAYYHVNALTQLALEKIGILTIPEFKWNCNLDLADDKSKQEKKTAKQKKTCR